MRDESKAKFAAITTVFFPPRFIFKDQNRRLQKHLQKLNGESITEQIEKTDNPIYQESYIYINKTLT